MSADDAIARLARQIESHANTEERLLWNPEQIAELRRRGSAELHALCAEFARSVNARLSSAALEVSPAEYASDSFRESGVNMIQISGYGRLIQIAFGSTRELFSTEKYRTPYILDGEIRTFNQEMLEHGAIHTQGLFYCVEQDETTWRFSDWRSNRTGVVDQGLLASLMERLF